MPEKRVTGDRRMASSALAVLPAGAGPSTADHPRNAPVRTSVTAPLDAALAASAAYHRATGLAAAHTSIDAPTPPFSVTRNVEGASAISGAHGLSVHGELDSATAPLLAAMFAQPDLDQGPGFVIDLRDVSFVDGAGIQLLHDMHDELSEAGQNAQVAPSTLPGARRTLRMAVANGWLPAAFMFSSTYAPRVAALASLADRVVADLDVAVRYLPAGIGGEPAAGDFFDVLLLSAGQVAIVLGDVSGHGESAAERRATLRAAVRAFALLNPSPDHVLTALERFQSLMEPDDLATVWYGLYTPATGGLEYAAAGHPPPLLWAGGYADVALLELATVPPLGAGFENPPSSSHHGVLPPGAFLVVYSDGLIERVNRDIDTQIESLRIAAQLGLQTAPLPRAADVAGHLLAMFIPDPEQARDDVCVAVVGRLAFNMPLS